MYLFALTAAAVLHDPCPADLHRFGFHDCPQDRRHINLVWSATGVELRRLTREVSVADIYGREQEHRDRVADAEWRNDCWNYLDDLSVTGYSPGRKFEAARKLKDCLGPLHYYLGEMPESHFALAVENAARRR